MKLKEKNIVDYDEFVIKLRKIVLSLLCLSFAMLVSTSSFAQTIVTGPYVSGTWTQNNSPYLVQSSILVHADSSLVIEPGVTVIFQGHFKLLVLGDMQAVGTPLDSIIFTASNTTLGWFGLRFDNTPSLSDSSRILYCSIQYGNANGSGNDASGGGIFLNNFSKVLIKNSLLKNTKQGGSIYCNNSNPSILSNVIKDGISNGILCNSSSPAINKNHIIGNSGTGITLSNNSAPLITENLIQNNNSTGGAGGIYGYLCNNKIIIHENIITNNSTTSMSGAAGGMAFDFCNLDITNNLISGNHHNNGFGGGIFIVESSKRCNIINNKIINNEATAGGGIALGFIDSMVFVSNNLIVNNSSYSSYGGGGIYSSSKNLFFQNNTIANNYSNGPGGAISFYDALNVNVENCILFGNLSSTTGNQIFLSNEASDPNFKFCDIEGGLSDFELNGTFYFGQYQNNMNASPDFSQPTSGTGIGFDAANADWSLLSNSSCINSGNPIGNYSTLDINGNPRVVADTIDIGAIEGQDGLGVRFANKSTKFKLLPNPCSEHFSLELGENKSFVEVSVMNILGKNLLNHSYINTSRVEIDMEEKAGTYFVKICIDGEYTILKLIKI